MAERVTKRKKADRSAKVRYSIRTKLIVLMTILVAVVMVSTALFLVVQKKKELTHDVYVNTRAFAELSADDVVENYETYLVENGFIQFNRVIQALFRKSEDVFAISVIGFNGDVLYDSNSEKLEQYEGDTRSIVENSALYERAQAPFPSVQVVGRGVVYLEKNPVGETYEVNLNGKKVEPIEMGDRVTSIVHPVGQKYAVVYGISYELLDKRIAQTYAWVGFLLLMGILGGSALAVIIGARVAKPVSALKEGALEVAKGHFDHRVRIYSKDELGLLADTFNTMAKDLKKSTKALMYKERVTKELELAKDIQNDLIPKKIPDIPSLDIAAVVNPAEEIGGDLYDFIQVDDHNTVIYAGDVTGHGVPAGLLVSVANAIIYAYRGLKDIHKIMTQTNAILQVKSRPNMFITMAMLNWDEKKKKMEYVSAGHEKIMHFSAKKAKVTELEAKGIALGMVPDASKLLNKLPIKMEKGDVIIIYSDGIPEAWGNKREAYGMARLRRAFLHAVEHNSHTPKNPSAQDMLDSMITDVYSFMGRHKQADDVSLMVIKRK